MSKINIEQAGNSVKVYTSGIRRGVYFHTTATVSEIRAAKHALGETMTNRDKALALRARFSN